VRAQFSKSDSGAAQVNQARVALAQAEDDFARRQTAFDTQSVSGDELAHARDAVAAARAAVTAAQGSLQQTNASIEGTDIAHNPDVMAAQAQLRAAAIAYGHMRLVAPLDGVIAQRTVQAGGPIQELFGHFARAESTGADAVDDRNQAGAARLDHDSSSAVEAPPGPGTMRGTWKKLASRRGAFARASSIGSEGAVWSDRSGQSKGTACVSGSTPVVSSSRMAST